MVYDGNGNYEYTVPEGSGTAQFKFTRGSWTSVEGDANGQEIPNRTFAFTGSPQIIELHVLSWKDLGAGDNSTAASNVHVLNASFFIPNLTDRVKFGSIYHLTILQVPKITQFCTCRTVRIFSTTRQHMRESGKLMKL